MMFYAWKWLLLVFISIKFCDGGGHECPDREIIRPCVCTEKTQGLDIVCDGTSLPRLPVILRMIAEKEQEILYLKLRNIPVEKSLQSFLFDGLHIIHLIIQNSTIITVSDAAFLGQEEKLQSLDLAHNQLETVPTSSIEHLSGLETLILNYNNIEDLHEGCFRGLSSLLHLSLYGNKISTIHNLAFQGFNGNLTLLNIGGNQLTFIPSRPLLGLSFIEKLQIQDNKIVSLIPDEFIEEGFSLDTLELTNNQIEELPKRAFSHLRINSLDLDRNRIKVIHPEAFEGVEESLRWLKLGRNKLEQIPTNSLINLTRLRQLDLNGNSISRVEKNSFHPYGHNIKFIYLQGNKISCIDPEAFQHLDSLEWLYLQSNQLEEILQETFSPILDTLQALDIHSNPFNCDCKLVWLRDWMLTPKGKTVISKALETKCKTPESLRDTLIMNIPSHIKSCTSSSSILQPFFVIIVAEIFFTLANVFATIS
ncbi:leucine-rich repeat-containing protein let-4-like [Centruroides vittatus]|uniref:leucine-rich repeat-containing protein let-4-like n=1 Tax=Centruroides vittatus TaxID=120091 RepID=UPI00350E901A